MITLHHVPYSRSMRIMWLLEEMGLSYGTETYAISDGSLRRPEFLAKAPSGRVPALEIDGQVIFESPAIAEYLCETRPDHGLGRLAGDPERIAFLQWLSFAETQASILGSLNMQMVFLRPPATPSRAVLKLEIARLRATVQVMEDALGDQDWLLPSGFSAADVMMGFNLFAVPYYVKLDAYPKVQAYINRMTARPAYQAVIAREGPQSFYSKDFYPLPDA